MGGEHAFLGEKRLVGRDQRQVRRVGERQQLRLDRRILAHPLAGDLDIEPVAEDRLEPGAGRFRRIILSGRQVPAERTVRAGERDQAFGMSRDRVAGDMGRRPGLDGQEGPGRQRQQVPVPGLVLGQQHEPVERVALEAVRIRRLEGDRQLAADDRLDAGPGAGLGEFERAEQIVGVGDRHRRHAVRFAERRDVRDLERPFGQRIGGMNPEMDEVGVGHGRSGAAGWGSRSVGSPNLHAIRAPRPALAHR